MSSSSIAILIARRGASSAQQLIESS